MLQSCKKCVTAIRQRYLPREVGKDDILTYSE